MTNALARDLLAFVDAAPTPYHAVAEMARRLESAGFTALDERERWSLQAGDARYVVRDGGSIVAFRMGAAAAADAGFRVVGAHTDSPTLKVRPAPDVRRHGYTQVGVEPYGGVLLHSWLDRDLTLAGRVAVRTPDGDIALHLVHVGAPMVRVPSLAIHLFREIREEGLKLDPQRHVVPILGGDAMPAVLEVVADSLDADPKSILGHELVTVDTQPAAVVGDYLAAPRMDNLASCHAGTEALCAGTAADATQVFVANDHEEVGSASAEGAAGTLLADVLGRAVAATDADQQAFGRAIARSRLVSADTAHAVHPNYAERHETEHRPLLGGGPVLKVNANQSYATDAGSAAWFAARCADAGVEVQHFVTRADLPCGSTIGPLTATRLGIQTVDVGNPILAMHSCREQGAVADVEPMIRALGAHFSAADQ